MRIVRSVFLYKLRAALLSFCVFLVFASLLSFATYHFWYPNYLFWIDGGIQGLRLVFAVDFVLGPLLALVFFHPEKSRKKLIFDVCVVAFVQASAMTWGAYQVYSIRPAVVVYGSDRFISVAPGLLAMQRKTPKDMRGFSDTNPPYAYRRETRSDDEKQKKITLLFRNGIHFEAQAWLFEPYSENLERIFSKQKGMQRYINESAASQWAEWSGGGSGRQLVNYKYAFYEGRYGNAILIFTNNGEYRGYLDLSTRPLPDVAEAPVESVNKAH